MGAIRVKQLIRSGYAWSHDQGELVSGSVSRRVSLDEQVQVDFSGVKALTLQFLNAAIGNLIRQVPWEDLRESVCLVNFPLEYSKLLEMILIVWREIEFDPTQIVKKTEVMQDITYLFTPFDKRRENYEASA